MALSIDPPLNAFKPARATLEKVVRLRSLARCKSPKLSNKTRLDFTPFNDQDFSERKMQTDACLASRSPTACAWLTEPPSN